MVPWNSVLGGFAYIWQSKWLGIIGIKTKRTRIHFLSDVLVAVASLDLKVPNDFVATTQKGFIYQIWQPLPNLDILFTGTPMIGKNADNQGIKHPIITLIAWFPFTGNSLHREATKMSSCSRPKNCSLYVRNLPRETRLDQLKHFYLVFAHFFSNLRPDFSC